MERDVGEALVRSVRCSRASVCVESRMVRRGVDFRLKICGCLRAEWPLRFEAGCGSQLLTFCLDGVGRERGCRP